ncbi:unnamed protein product [Penicillium discolor]
MKRSIKILVASATLGDSIVFQDTKRKRQGHCIVTVRNIARPHELEGPYRCALDGSLSRDPMLEDLQELGRPLTSDWELRERIYYRYLHFEESPYENQLLNMLPRSERSVFTNANIAPRNIIVEEQNNVTGILDWRSVGWYPEY